MDATPAQPRITLDQVRGWANEGLALVKRVDGELSDRPRLDGMTLNVGGGTSFYFPVTGTATIGTSRIRNLPVEKARREIIETTIHESTHHMVRNSAGFPGLLAHGGPGRVGEGLSQVVAGAAMALYGTSEDDRAWGARVLDPSWQTTPVGEFRKRDVPLSLTMDDVRDGRIRWWEDAGHVHGGVITNAHRIMAEKIGMKPMARLTLEAMDHINPLTGMQGWAAATVRAASELHGKDSPEVAGVRDAWAAVKLRFDK